MKISHIQDLSDSVEDFLSQNGRTLFEGEVLFHLAFKSKGEIVEIGSWKGKSTIWLSKGSESGLQNKIYAIDPHAGSKEHLKGGKNVWTFDDFQKNLSKCKVDRFVIPLKKKSSEAVKDVSDNLGLVFIDGAHDYFSVKQDFMSWMPKISEGGVIAFHDSFGKGWDGVRKVVHKEIFKSKVFKNVRYINGITYATKVNRTTLMDRLSNRLSLGVKIFHEKSLSFPQPFKSLAKKLIWRPFQRKWLEELRF